jgi:hypothetical protein
MSNMLFQLNHSLTLSDARGLTYGWMTLESHEEPLLQGVFVPGPDFLRVSPLFRQFEEAVNEQALSTVNRLDAAISALGLVLSSPDGSEQTPVYDVQIWTDGGISCRLVHPVTEPLNGTATAAPAIQPTSSH